MNEKLADALNEIQDHHIQEAAKPRGSRKKIFLRVAAAAAAVALVVGISVTPPSITAKAVSLPGDSRSNGRYDLAAQASTALSSFFCRGSAQFISGQSNAIWSPVNAFIGLSMTAELTQGDSRQQILELLGTEDMQTLRDYATNIWEQVYKDSGNEVCTLANSLWLDENLSYDQSAMNHLSYYYYASVYKGQMGSEKMNNAIGAWLERNTGGFLKKSTNNISLTPDTVMALYSTMYFQSKWQNEFEKSQNTTDYFYSPSGKRQATYMNKNLTSMRYCWADKFGAVQLYLKNGSQMWFVLPDEGVSVDEVLADGQYMQMITGEWENSDYYLVNLSVPKFDITTSLNLQTGLENMGVTDVFDSRYSNFSKLTGDTDIVLSGVRQNVRIQIDEEGVKAAVYIEIPGATSAQPPEKTVDFILNRPFLFVISKSTVPLFVGTIHEP